MILSSMKKPLFPNMVNDNKTLVSSNYQRFSDSSIDLPKPSQDTLSSTLTEHFHHDRLASSRGLKEMSRIEHLGA